MDKNNFVGTYTPAQPFVAENEWGEEIHLVLNRRDGNWMLQW